VFLQIVWQFNKIVINFKVQLPLSLMIKRFTILFALVLMLQVSKAQSYNLNPGNSVSGSIDPTGTLFLEIKMENVSGSVLNLSWDRLSNTTPVGWTIAICDFTECFPTIPVNGVMDPVPAGGEGFIKLTVQPGGIEGMGAVTFRVYNADIPSEEDVITFNIESIVGINEYDLGSEITFFPNPTVDQVNLSALNGTLGKGTVKIMNAFGAVVMETAINDVPSQKLDVSHLATGLYVLHFENARGTVARKLIKN
jgi:Secretion system C-terminal sorting domain